MVGGQYPARLEKHQTEGEPARADKALNAARFRARAAGDRGRVVSPVRGAHVFSVMRGRGRGRDGKPDGVR